MGLGVACLLAKSMTLCRLQNMSLSYKVYYTYLVYQILNQRMTL